MTDRNVKNRIIAIFGLFLKPFARSFSSINFLSSNPVEETQNTMKTFINALNDYDATAAWNLMSPNLQTSYGTIQNFTDSYVKQLQQTGWHTQLLGSKVQADPSRCTF